jgi:hypothetical protein
MIEGHGYRKATIRPYCSCGKVAVKACRRCGATLCDEHNHAEDAVCLRCGACTAKALAEDERCDACEEKYTRRQKRRGFVKWALFVTMCAPWAAYFWWVVVFGWADTEKVVPMLGLAAVAFLAVGGTQNALMAWIPSRRRFLRERINR